MRTYENKPTNAVNRIADQLSRIIFAVLVGAVALSLVEDFGLIRTLAAI